MRCDISAVHFKAHLKSHWELQTRISPNTFISLRHCAPKPRTPVTPRQRQVIPYENYNISNLHSSDETDDETEPRKEIPFWAQGTHIAYDRCIFGNRLAIACRNNLHQAMNIARRYIKMIKYVYFAIEPQLMRAMEKQDAYGQYAEVVFPASLRKRVELKAIFGENYRSREKISTSTFASVM